MDDLVSTELELDEEYLRQAELIMLTRLNDAIDAVKDRNDDLADYDDLLEGIDIKDLDLPYSGACEIVDPITREQVTSLLANLAQPLRRETLVMVADRRAIDKELARKTETWLTDVWADEGLKDIAYTYLQNLLRDHAGVIYSGWSEKTHRINKVMFARYDAESGGYAETYEDGQPVLMEAEDTDPNAEYIEVETEEDEVYFAGGEYRCVDLVDFFLYPANAPSVEKATCTFERILYTEDELLAGIETYGFDEEAVMRMIRTGPTHNGAAQGYSTRRNGTTSPEYRERQDQAQGVSGAVSTSGDGVYECFLCFGRLPKVWGPDTEALLPKEFWDQEMVMMICRDHRVMFLLAACPYSRKPYFMRSLLPKNNRAYGTGMVEMVQPLVYELTHMSRQTLNGLDLQVCPVLQMDDEAWERNKRKEVKPGTILRKGTGGAAVEPVVMGQGALLGFEGMGYVQNRIKALTASQGYGEMNAKVRKAAEVQNAVLQADTKFDLYQYNAYRIFEDLAKWRVELQLQFDRDFTSDIDTNDGEMEITAADLRGSFRYTVAQTNADSNPDARREQASAIMGIQSSYFNAVMQFPDRAEEIYYAHRQALLAIDERNPEKVLGEKPDPMQMLSPMPADPMAGQNGAMPGGMPMPPEALAGIVSAPDGGVPAEAMPPMYPPLPMIPGGMPGGFPCGV